MSLLNGLRFILLLALVLCYFCNAQNYIELVTTQEPVRDRVSVSGLHCPSWRLAVETNNLRDWKTVPSECKDYVKEYMTGGQYERDCYAVAAIANEYAYDYVKNRQLNSDGKGVWIFDIDETCLSNLPYYAREEVAFGTEQFKSETFWEWVKKGTAPANTACLSLHKNLTDLGVKVVFLTGAGEMYKAGRVQNMKDVGFKNIDNDLVFFRQDREEKTIAFKSRIRTELEEEDKYRIIGNMGDQWSDIQGPHSGLRTFKMPNPMYYF